MVGKAWRIARQLLASGGVPVRYVMVLAVVMTALSGSVAIIRTTEPDEARIAIPDEAPFVVRPVAAPATSTLTEPARSSSVSSSATTLGPTTVADLGAPATTVDIVELGVKASPDEDVGSVLTAVARIGDSGLLAVGSTGDGAAIVLASSDGSQWSRLADGEDALGSARVQDAEDAGDRVIAVGSADGVAAAWTTRNGQDWKPIDVEFANKGVGYLASVASHGGRVVATGFEVGGASTWVLTSAGFEPTEQVGSSGDGLLLDSATVAGGTFVAGGNDGVGAVLWRSDDGLAWRRADISGTTTRAVIKDLATADDLLVAVGYDHEGPRAWVSRDDGATWTAVNGPEVAAARPQLLTAVVALGDAIVATGQGDGAPLCWLRPGAEPPWAACNAAGDAEVALPVAIEAIDSSTAIAVGRIVRANRDGIALWHLERKTQQP